MSSYRIISYPGTDPALEPYQGLIYSFFLKSLRDGNGWFEDIDKETYFEIYPKIIQHLLNRPQCTAQIAVLTDDPDVFLGWSLCEETVLHYVFVKPAYQRQGIGKALLPKKMESFSHLTRTGRHLWKRKYPRIKFSPFFN